MRMHIVLVGVNHRSSPIEVRERLAFRQDQLPAALACLRREIGLREATILSTCNRVEIYGGVPELDGTVQRLSQFLSDHARMDLRGLAEQLYSFTEPESVQHLFAVAGGLDSMVLGEHEILQQVKAAYEWAREHGATGKLLNGLFQRALNAGKTVRTRTALGAGCRSIGAVAVELAGKIFGDLRQASVLLVGAGEIGELTLARLAERGVRRLRIMNRSMERAAQLAARYGVASAPLDALEAQMAEADIIISSISAPEALITRAQLAAAMPRRHRRALCVIDLGVPRNVEPSVGELENIFLFNVDDLQGLVDRSAREREHAVGESRMIIEQKVDRFLAWWREDALVASPEAVASRV